RAGRSHQCIVINTDDADIVIFNDGQQQQALSGPNVTNIVLQKQDPGFAGGHLDIAISYQVWQDVLGMLANNPAASPQQPAAAIA
ncbi:hypothetical protein, partial [Mycobacterium sp. SMC-13]|uniref:hypothetical protein n=1 Tax=Mycobacterium sp. SMC-13 TaxID=3381626 RepID=UPI003875CCB1